METVKEVVQVPKRKYQHVWEKITATPGKSVKVKATNIAMLRRIKKAVTKEKDIDKTRTAEGHVLKELWRLTSEIDIKAHTIIFKLVPTNHIAHL
jgi:hypothetical protein